MIRTGKECSICTICPALQLVAPAGFAHLNVMELIQLLEDQLQCCQVVLLLNKEALQHGTTPPPAWFVHNASSRIVSN